MTQPALRAYLVIFDADDGRVVRLFRLERKAIQFVHAEHRRRWNHEDDDFIAGCGFEWAELFRCTLTGSRLLDTYSTDADANGDARCWRDPARNEIATAYEKLLSQQKAKR